ncbi:MAG: hypothetical protein M3Y64_08765, partial [Gemmatimonadota bacterium]|nr:hypothetical protein [Gemmatimonadota bacterium]
GNTASVVITWISSISPELFGTMRTAITPGNVLINSSARLIGSKLPAIAPDGDCEDEDMLKFAGMDKKSSEGATLESAEAAASSAVKLTSESLRGVIYALANKLELSRKVLWKAGEYECDLDGGQGIGATQSLV